MDTDLERFLAEIRRRVEAEGRYALSAESGYGWKPEGLRWAGAMLALSSLEEWALRHFGEVGGEDEGTSLPR